MFITQILVKFDSSAFKYSSCIPPIHVGELITLGIRISERQKLRIQNYRGLILSKKRNLATSSIRIRKIFQKVGVEKIFPLDTPQIILSPSSKKYKFRRSKLYFLRSNVRKVRMIK